MGSMKKSSAPIDGKINWERLFCQIDNALASILAVKEELHEYYGRPLTVAPTRGRRQEIEGVFDGKYLTMGQKKYPIPENYISKSKLVAGDKLKLTIGKDGNFVFKQIGPVERKKQVGKLVEINGGFAVQIKSRLYKILTASVTFFQAKPGDYLTVILPKTGETQYAAVEHKIN